MRLILAAFVLWALAHLGLYAAGFAPDSAGPGHWERLGTTEIWRYD